MRVDSPGRRLRTFKEAAALSLLILVTPVLAGQTESPSQIEEGARLFDLYCQTCHGAKGKGDGPLADDLIADVPDLTTITQRSDGKTFPAEEVARFIDGRVVVGPHGTREMPVWGLSFATPGRVDNEESEVQARLRALVAYLKTIQKIGK